MLILGIHGGEKFEYEDDLVGFANHDGAAVLLKDGEIIAAIEEERLNRVKHSNCFPVRAIEYCLDQGHCGLRDVDAIATNHSEFHADLAARFALVANPCEKRQPDGRSHLGGMFQKAFDVDVRDKIYFCHHHFAHAWSALLPSGFDSALVYSVDGDGDGASGMVLLASNQRLTKIKEFKLEQSLGNLYQRLMRMVGYDRFDEYKVMGLAPYGQPERFRRLFQRCYELLPQGNYELEPPMTWFGTFDTAGLTMLARRKGEPFLQVHKDFAAALQEMTETIALHVLRHHHEITKEKRLCLAGGVAHNCSMNGKVLYSGLFEDVFVQPAAHDAGGALGAAFSVWCEKGVREKPKKLSHVYWGTDIGADHGIESALARWSEFLTYDRHLNITGTTARLLAEGAVVGWVQGRSEFGPRALGNRSILADPRPAQNKLRINEMIKKREEYRPFAPSVLEESVGEFFETPSVTKRFPFMSVALRVRPGKQELLGATTHVDGTARVQSVSYAANPKYWNLIKEFQRLTGVPVLLNTSFNNNAEPIVDSVDDAVACFLTTGIDYLVIGNQIVTKKSPAEIRGALATTIPVMAPSRKLVKRTRAGCSAMEVATLHSIESAKSGHFGPTSYELSAEMFQLLQAANEVDDFESLVRRTGIVPREMGNLLTEMMALWTNRLLRIVPSVRGNRALDSLTAIPRRSGQQFSVVGP